METRQQKIAKIIADNVHHSAQLNATVIHGAIDEIEKLIDDELSKLQEERKEQSQRIQQLEGLLREALPLLSYTGYNGIAKKIEALLKSSS